VTEPAIQISRLTKSYSGTRALDGVDLSVGLGSVFGYLGPNGSGKTTTIRIMLGLIRPDGGSVRLLGDPVSLVHRRAKVGALVERPAFYPYLGAVDNLRLLGAAARLPVEVVESTASRLLDRLDLAAVGHKRVGGFSTGMKQRLAIAAALLGDPDLVILDEPTDGLDAAGIIAVRELIRELAKIGKTVFLSSHLLAEVEQVCDRLAVLANGKIVTEGATAELLGPGVRLIANFASREKSELATALLTEHGIPALLVSGMPRSDNIAVTIETIDSQRVLNLLSSGDLLPTELRRDKPSLETMYLKLTAQPDEEAS
jgi:ABC-2 type transport system ATP-binding protein